MYGHPHFIDEELKAQRLSRSRKYEVVEPGRNPGPVWLQSPRAFHCSTLPPRRVIVLEEPCSKNTC